MSSQLTEGGDRWSPQVLSALIAGVFSLLVAIVSAIVAFSTRDTAKEALGAANNAVSDAQNAVSLATSKGQCRDGSELSQTFLVRPIEVLGGQISLQTSETSVRELPREVPGDARFVQVFATITTGDAQERGFDRLLKISSKESSAQTDCSAYLFFRTYSGAFYAYSSVSSWLPVASDRKISTGLISLDGSGVTPLHPDASATARVFVTAYR